MLNNVGELVIVQVAFVLNTLSTASSNAPSKAIIGIPCPSPGSNTPKKYSAKDISIDLILEIPPLIKRVFLNKGPQLFELSFRRIFIRIVEVVFGTICALATILSTASSQAPSTTPKGVPFPFPGSNKP